MKRTLGLLVLSMLLVNTATGCSSYSEDRDVFKSTYMSPKSVYVAFKPSNETTWSYDIPPQHLLVVERDADDSNISWARAPKGYPTSLKWELWPIDAKESFWANGHFHGTPLEAGEIKLNGTPMIIGSTVGDPIDPASVPTERTIEDIEKDLPEPDALPDPEGEEAAEEAAE